MFYVVEFSEKSGRDLVNMAIKRTNMILLVVDTRKPLYFENNLKNIEC
jgi:fibrillarin-like rRNA methylase